jgi:restriction modification system DNA specificity domain protein
MEEWKEYKLHEIGRIVGGATPPTKDSANYDGEISWITPKDLSNFTGRYIQKGERSITQKGFDSSSCQILPKGSILFSSRAPIGYIAIAANELCTNQGFKSIIPDNNLVNNLFLYYLLKYNKEEIEGLGSGTTFKEVSAKVMQNFDIKIPSIQTQKKIADILSSLDDKIELNRRINDNLEQQAQALFKSWFVNFEPFKNGQFVDSELGKIPKGWKVGYLSEIADIIMGQSPNGSTYNENGEGIIFYQGRAEFGTRFPSIRLFTTNPTRIAPANSILISVRAPVGDINITHKECCIGRGLASAVSRTNKSAFLLYTLFSLKSDLDRFNAEGTVFGSINRKTLESLKILIPTNDIISKFEAIVASMDQQILTLHLESENLKILRDTLLPKLMSGERSVIHKENNDD